MGCGLTTDEQRRRFWTSDYPDFPSIAVAGMLQRVLFSFAESAAILDGVMPMLFRIATSAGAALSVVAACSVAVKAAAQAPAQLIIGPEHLGSAVTYRVTTSDGSTGNAPSVQTVALHWKLGQKIVVTLGSVSSAQAMPLVATRGADGTLTLDNVSSEDVEGQRIVTAIGALNRLDDFVSAAPAGAKTWTPTLVVQPPAPRAMPASDAPVARSTQAPQPLNVPVTATRNDDATGTTLAASGSIDRALTRPSGGGSPRGGGGGGTGGGMGRRGGGGMGGGGMGGGRMGGSLGSSSGPKSIKVTTKVTIDAHFDRNGELTSGSIVETNQSADSQSEPSTRSWLIERTQ